MRNSSYLYQCNSRITVAVGRLFHLFYPNGNTQILLELLEICPSAIEKIWPMWWLVGFFSPNISYVFQSMHPIQSMKSLKQKET